ncbi:MAG: hypothetical protein ACYC2E_13140 [Sulfuricella sp.]
MTVSKFITTPKLFEYLDTEVAAALIRHDIRKLFDYAWVDEDTPSDEYIGLAKWGSDGIGSIYSIPANLKNPPKPYTKNQYEKLITVADDLEALMEIARLSIGHTLWMADLAKLDTFNDNHHFWLNQINSLTLLGMASDRIRDLFMEAYHHSGIDKYKKKFKDEPIDDLTTWDFQYPFAAARNIPKQLKNSSNQPEFDDQLACLFVLSESISINRRVRNSTVHKAATRAGLLTKCFFKTVKSHPGRQSASVYHHEYECYIRMQARNNAQPSHAETLDSALTLVIDWYHDLVKVTSIVFDIEHSLRMDELQISPRSER